MNATKNSKYIEESKQLYTYTTKDLKVTSGIKIKNSPKECYLKRLDEVDKEHRNLSEEYWVRCRMVHGKIVEINRLDESELLKKLNEDRSNYILIPRA